MSLAGAGGGGGDVQVFISYFWMWWIFQFTYHTSFQSFFFFAFQLFGARFTDAFEMIKKNIFYCEIMLFPPLSNWICLSSVAQYPLDCSHTKPTRHNVISSSPIPHNSKKKTHLNLKRNMAQNSSRISRVTPSEQCQNQWKYAWSLAATAKKHLCYHTCT